MKQIISILIALTLLLSFAVAGEVVIEPNSPDASVDLIGYVDGEESTTFTFYWLKDGYTEFVETGKSSTLDETYTEAGDVWTVQAWVPESAFYDSFFYGSESVEVRESLVVIPFDDDNDYIPGGPLFGDENNAPRATDIHLTVIEGALVDVDMAQVSNSVMFNIYETLTSGMQSDTIYTYDADGDALKISYGSLLNPFGMWQTEDGDDGVYTVIGTVTDGEDSTEAVITITVLNSGDVEVNTCPVVSADDITVYEGELAVADYTTSDADGDSLDISFSSPFDSDGEWQTEDGDAGMYTATVYVSDGECAVEDDFTVSVLAGPEDGNHAPKIDDITDIEVKEGEAVVITAVATDEDGDVLTYTFEGIEGSQSGNVWNWQTEAGDAGEYPVIVTVSDGELSDSTSLTVYVALVDEDGNVIEIGSNYEGSLLSVVSLQALNAGDLYSAYDVSELNVETTGVFYVEDGYLRSSASNDFVKVLLAMKNENSFDADDIDVVFILEGKSYRSSFEDLDSSEQSSQIYTISLPENLDSGSYPLTVIVTSDDISYESVINLNVKSLGDYITNGDSSVVEESFWEWLKSLFLRFF